MVVVGGGVVVVISNSYYSTTSIEKMTNPMCVWLKEQVFGICCACYVISILLGFTAWIPAAIILAGDGGISELTNQHPVIYALNLYALGHFVLIGVRVLYTLLMGCLHYERNPTSKLAPSFVFDSIFGGSSLPSDDEEEKEDLIKV
jgi:hypothetical protein